MNIRINDKYDNARFAFIGGLVAGRVRVLQTMITGSLINIELLLIIKSSIIEYLKDFQSKQDIDVTSDIDVIIRFDTISGIYLNVMDKKTAQAYINIIKDDLAGIHEHVLVI